MIYTHFDNMGGMSTYIGHYPMPIPMRIGLMFMLFGMIFSFSMLPFINKDWALKLVPIFLFGGVVIFIISTIVASFTDPIAMFGYGY